MGSRQTLDVLQSYASLLSGCGDQRGAEAARALVSALSAAGDASIKSTVAKVAKVWSMPQSGVSPFALSSRLGALQSLLAAGGGKVASADVKLLIGLLDTREEVSPAEFELALRDAILLPPLKAATKSKVSKRTPLTDAEIRQCADRLTVVSADQNAFETELSVIQAIPKLSVEELRSIAEHYLGYRAAGVKAKILKIMRARQKQDAIEAGRQSRIERIAV